MLSEQVLMYMCFKSIHAVLHALRAYCYGIVLTLFMVIMNIHESYTAYTFLTMIEAETPTYALTWLMLQIQIHFAFNTYYDTAFDGPFNLQFHTCVLLSTLDKQEVKIMLTSEANHFRFL